MLSPSPISSSLCGFPLCPRTHPAHSAKKHIHLLLPSLQHPAISSAVTPAAITELQRPALLDPSLEPIPAHQLSVAYHTRQFFSLFCILPSSLNKAVISLFLAPHPSLATVPFVPKPQQSWATLSIPNASSLFRSTLVKLSSSPHTH